MICFYHKDHDGEASAAIVKYYAKTNNELCRCFPVNYNNPIPFKEISKDEEVWVVDFSLQKPGEWNKLKRKAGNVVWIDHHKTAIEASIAQKADRFDGIREVGLAGCELTWKYCFDNTNYPQAVAYVADYDVWRFAFGDKTKDFNNGLSFTIDTRPYSPFWSMMLAPDAKKEQKKAIKEILAVGAKIRAKQTINNTDLLEQWGFEIDFEGYKALGVNRGQVGSAFFESIGQNYDILMPMIFDGEQWTVSLYQSGNGADIDLGEIAKKYGGGGHKGAAGFQCQEFPFTITKRLGA